jgi:very-short-patch-repair endonuclease
LPEVTNNQQQRTKTRSAGLEAGFRAALCQTFADVLKRQRTAATPLARWTDATRRAHEFVWLGGVFETEQLMLGGAERLSFAPDDPLFDAVHKMYGTAKLNPYEREVLYGFPYVVGRQRDKKVRGPLLTLAVEIEAVGPRLELRAADEIVRFNSLPFRSDKDTDAHERALARVQEQTPSFPLTVRALQEFVGVVTRELPDLGNEARLDGSLGRVPAEPGKGERIWMIDQAALFVAPKTNYFLATDLDEIGSNTEGDSGSLQPLVEGAGDEEQVDLTDRQIDAAQIFFPFPSNRAQRRVALLLDDPTTQVVRVEGPPGTGKSLTIANLACHLAATNKRVLVTSQKDKALEVVDAKLRELNLAELPMTLLRHDRESKRDLLSRLERVEKHRGKDEVESHFVSVTEQLGSTSSAQLGDADAFAEALRWEDEIERAHQSLRSASRVRRIARGWRAASVLRRADRRAPDATDDVAARVRQRREELLGLSLEALRIGLERGVAGAKRSERQVVRELHSVLKRDQRAHRNFSIFDRLKKQVDQAEKLLGILPVWVLSPDDVARLFPCVAGLFDVVIIDEASQVDLPSILPIVYRAKKLAVFGDTKQMQSQRFAFMSANVATQAWQQHGMPAFDEVGRLDPMKQSLLDLATVHAEEECLLDEHFRSLPPIIEFSNQRWYDNRLRIMTDSRQKRFGLPSQPIIEMHLVPEGVVSNGHQENENEARALIDFLARMVTNPDYASASIGVLCLFEEQVALVNELVAEVIDPGEWVEHGLVVVNPDGFQGDERDIILYSMSWDNREMPQAALSARQMDTPQVQGMLNVAFTRARDEIHVFHSAPIETFGMAGGRAGALGEWMTHCAMMQEEGGQRTSHRHGRVDSEFEMEVAEALRAQGVEVLHQYPACGFSIDLLCRLDEAELAVECDGELYHQDEHGTLRLEDVERQAILERAGWTVLRIPYRKWLKLPEQQLDRVLAELRGKSDGGPEAGFGVDLTSPPVISDASSTRQVTREQRVLIEGLRRGLRAEADLLRYARDNLGYKRLGPRIRDGLLVAAKDLNHAGLVVIEDGEYFLTPAGRSAVLVERPVTAPPRARSTVRRRRTSQYRSSYRRRRY